jgi:hypothetical protein
MVEFGTKGLQTREPLHRTRFRISVADRADRTRIVGELSCMASGTGQVAALAGKSDAGRIVVAAVA